MPGSEALRPRLCPGAEGLSGERGVHPAAPHPPGSWVQPEQALRWGQVLERLPSPPGKGRRRGWEVKWPD